MRITRTTTLIGMVMAAALACAAPALAAGVPFSGELLDGENPAEGSFDMLFEVHDAMEGGALVWSESLAAVDVADGRFSVTLGEDGSLDEALDGRPLWVEMTVEEDALWPRLELVRVPYAVWASRAGGLTPAGLGEVEQQLSDGGALADILARLDAIEDAGPDPAIAELEARVAALEDRVEAAESFNTLLAGRVATLEDENDALSALVASLTTDTETLRADLDDATDSLDEVTTRLGFLSREGDDVFMEGVNVHVRSGAGAGAFDSVTGAFSSPESNVGNLIVGYNEFPPAGAGIPVRQGSHNLVIGPGHGWRAHGSIIAGTRSMVAVTAGTAVVYGASVLGGRQNRATEAHSVAVGGNSNRAEGAHSVAVGGNSNRAEGAHSVAVGGNSNVSLGDQSTVLGGSEQTASGTNSIAP